jgi:hypothetical protein
MTVVGFVVVGIGAILLIRSLFRKSVSLLGLALLLIG